MKKNPPVASKHKDNCPELKSFSNRLLENMSFPISKPMLSASVRNKILD